MLEFLRKMNDKMITKILMGLLIFSFVGWGVAGWIFGDSGVDDSILRVGNSPLKIASFEAEQSRIMSALPRDQQRQIFADSGLRHNFMMETLTRMTTQMMLMERADDLGLMVSNTQIANVIKSEPAFQVRGKFDIAKYDMTLAMAQMTEEQLSNSIRGDILRQMVLSGVNEKFTAPKFMSDALHKTQNARREIEYTAVNFGNYKIAKKPTDEQLRETYARNPKKIAESRSVSYVLIPTKMSAPDAFDAGYKRAQNLEDALIGGEPMAAAAKKFGGKFVAPKPISRGAKIMDDVLIAADIFAMDTGIESAILETKNGFAIVRVDKIAPEHNAEFDAVKSELVVAWRTAEQEKQAYAHANELLTAANDGKKFGEKTATIGRTTGAPLAVLNAAFANKIGTKTIVRDKNTFYVLDIKKNLGAFGNAKDNGTATTMLNQMVSDDYMNFLQKKYPVKINEKNYKRTFVK
ncbi:MAG: SurA N-terminal domain-containing protein [Rickettsiales bacterium]|jgi:hypothetical protein|nr:SurA N-terminal domain-containing protein [Rickettsiales bacterium]